MKRNLLKKIGAVALALAVSMTMGVSVFAATGPDNTNGNFGTSSGQSTGGTFTPSTELFSSAITTATFNVHLEIKSQDTKLPKTQFSYSIANGTAKAATSTTPAINAGVTGGATLPSSAVTDQWDTVNSTTEVDTITLTFDATKFLKPGIYRYVLTEANLTAEQTDIGITDGDKNGQHTENVLYLDVYAQEVSGNMSVVAAVLTPSADAPTLSDEQNTIANTKETATYATKIDGFYNCYEAYTVVLEKEVTGAMGEQDRMFDFSMDLSYTEGSDANTTIAGHEIKAEASGTTASCNSTYTVGSTATDIKMQHTGKVTLKGVSKKTIIKLMETGVQAGDGYNITSAVTDMDASVNLTPAVNTETAYKTTGTVKGADGAIKYTNNRGSISPTNVVIKFAPFLFIFGAAVLLLVVMRRRKAQDAE